MIGVGGVPIEGVEMETEQTNETRNLTAESDKPQMIREQ